MKWHVCLIEAAEKELANLPADLKAKFVRIAEMLETFGAHEVGLPHVRPLQGKLWEIRMSGKDGIARAAYVAASGQRLIVVHVFVKKTQKTPRQAIAIALARAKELES